MNNQVISDISQLTNEWLTAVHMRSGALRMWIWWPKLCRGMAAFYDLDCAALWAGL